MTEMVCGRCYQDRGMVVPLTVLIGVTRLKTLFCSFCDEERRIGTFHVRIFQWGDKPETVLNIPLVMAKG